MRITGLVLLAALVCSGCATVEKTWDKVESGVSYAFAGDEEAEDAAFEMIHSELTRLYANNYDWEIGSATANSRRAKNLKAIDQYEFDLGHGRTFKAFDIIQDEADSPQAGIPRAFVNFFTGDDEVAAGWARIFSEMQRLRVWERPMVSLGFVVDENGDVLPLAMKKRDDTLAKHKERTNVFLDMIVDLAESTESINPEQPGKTGRRLDQKLDKLLDIVKDKVKDKLDDVRDDN